MQLDQPPLTHINVALPPPNPADEYVERMLNMWVGGTTWVKKYPFRIAALSFFAAVLLFPAAAVFAGAINDGTTVPQLILGAGVSEFRPP